MTGWLNEKEAAVDSCVLNISFSLGSKFLSEIRRVLILDVLHDWVPASIVVDLITISWCIDNVQSQTDTILLDDVRDSLDLGGRSYWLIWGKSSLGVDQV